MHFCFLLLNRIQMGLPTWLKLMTHFVREFWLPANPRPRIIDIFFAFFHMLITRRGLINQLAQVVSVQSMQHIISRDLQGHYFCASDCWVLELLIRSHKENLFANPSFLLSNTKFIGHSLFRIQCVLETVHVCGARYLVCSSNFWLQGQSDTVLRFVNYRQLKLRLHVDLYFATHYKKGVSQFLAFFKNRHSRLEIL